LGGTSAHHQERIQLYLQHLVIVTLLLLSAALMEELLYMFQVVPPPIIRSTYNCIYSIWYLSHRYCYLPLSRKSWNSSAIEAGSSNGVTNTRCFRYSCMHSWWWVEVPPETCRAVSRYNKLCNVASCWIYIGIFLCCTDSWTLNVHVNLGSALLTNVHGHHADVLLFHDTLLLLLSQKLFTGTCYIHVSCWIKERKTQQARGSW
jgi:hypothetical protein